MPHTLAAPAHSELIIKKSRFIGCVQPMADRASAQAAVDALWKQHPGAAHLCGALRAGGQSARTELSPRAKARGRPRQAGSVRPRAAQARASSGRPPAARRKAAR